MTIPRVLIHVARSEHRVIDPADVYLLEARGGETEIRLRSSTPLIDVRPIAEVMPSFEALGFVRIHLEHAVNPIHIRVIRLQADGRDWEVKMQPPVNRVLPVARDRLQGLKNAFQSP